VSSYHIRSKKEDKKKKWRFDEVRDDVDMWWQVARVRVYGEGID